MAAIGRRWHDQEALNPKDDVIRLRRRFTVDFPTEGPFVGAGAPQPDAMAFVGWDQNKLFPAYRAVETTDAAVDIPFTPTVRFPPASYAGPDYYVDQFTDAKIKEAWGTCRSDPACLVRVLDGMSMLDVPHQFRMTESVDAQGRIDPPWRSGSEVGAQARLFRPGAPSRADRRTR